jgi:hypothetical protein
MVIATAQAKELRKEHIAPNAKLGAERVLVSHLAGIFWERTRKDPREHIQGNNAKDKYSGDFFYFADAILRKVGSHQSEARRGKMIVEQLRTLWGAEK